MDEQKKPVLSFLQKLKEKTGNQEHYGGNPHQQPAGMDAADCPGCGAGRAKRDGVTHCAYCGFEFIRTQLTDGLNIGKEDNSRK